MRVFAATPLYPPHSRVGAWLATHEFLKALVARGHDVTVMPQIQKAENTGYTLDGVDVVANAGIDERIAAADVVVSHLGDKGNAHRGARAAGVPTVLLVHSPRHDAARRIRESDAVVANSRASADAIHCNRAVVCHPPTWPGRHRTDPGECVTLVNVSAVKGAELFWRLARRLPGVPFLAVAGGYGRQIVQDLPNVTVLGTQEDMRAVWSRTRVLLMPSAKESWGMTGVEAMCSGIPVVAHPTPGLKESLGDAGVFMSRHKPNAWTETVRRLLEPDRWQQASERALRRVAELDPQASVDRFCDTVESVVTESVAA